MMTLKEQLGLIRDKGKQVLIEYRMFGIGFTVIERVKDLENAINANENLGDMEVYDIGTEGFNIMLKIKQKQKELTII